MKEHRTTVLLAGGGSGGHIYPNIAVAERLGDRGVDVDTHFVVSDRPLDGQIGEQEQVAMTRLDVLPVDRRPWRWPGWLARWRRSTCTVKRLLTERHVAAVIATGGFVAGPVVVAANRAAVPVAMVNLDAAPGRANRMLAGRADVVFSLCKLAAWPHATVIAMPLRRGAVGDGDAAQARRHFGLDPDRPTLLACGGSQGARSINAVMMHLAEHHWQQTPWQVLHLAGPSDDDDVRWAYERARVPAAVLAFTNQMGLVWSAADVAVSRAGAGSVAEAHANATPTIFLPYPWHKDDHQRLNAQPLVEAGGALLLTDQIDPARNAEQLAPLLQKLFTNDETRRRMKAALEKLPMQDGAAALADWVVQQIDD